MQNIKTETNIQKCCVECSKTGASLFQCVGCEKSFCPEHVLKHRQDNGARLDMIGLNRDQIQEDLNKKLVTHPLIALIDKWEKDSLAEITQAASLARRELRVLERQRQEALKISFERITKELQSARQADDYCQIELEKWSQKLTGFRKELDTSVDVRYISDSDVSPIHLIRIEQIPSITNLDDQEQNLNTDCFDTIIAGPITLSEDNHLAMYTGRYLGGYASVRTREPYSKNTCEICFCLEFKSDNYIFLGIVSASEPFIPRAYKSSSAYGWRDINFTMNKGTPIDKSTRKDKQTFQSGDEILLTLDCDNRRLDCLHKRTMIHDTLDIDLQACPLPWYIVVSMVGMKDRIRIL